MVQHEIEHVVRLHCVRHHGLDHDLFNIAADMCVNGTMAFPRIGIAHDESNRPVIPLRRRIFVDLAWRAQTTRRSSTTTGSSAIGGGCRSAVGLGNVAG